MTSRAFTLLVLGSLAFMLSFIEPSPADAAPKPIQCGASIVGSVTLASDLTCPSGHGLVVRAGAVLDCAGHRITGGNRTGQYGIYVRDGGAATVKNCVAERFEVGIRVRGMQGGVLKQNVAQDNLRYGIEVTQNSTAMRIKKNQVLDNGDEGIHLSGPDAGDGEHEIVGNTIEGNLVEGIYLLRSHGNRIANNTIRGHGTAGIYVKESDRNALDGNTLIDDPIHVVAGSSQNVLSDNTIVGQQLRFKDASDNQVYRMTVQTVGGRPSVAYELMGSSRNTITDSSVTAIVDYDIRATSGSTGNVVSRLVVPTSIDCSVDKTSSVRVTNGRGAAVTCASK